MTSPVSAVEAIEEARLVIRVAGPLTAYAYTEADDDGDYMTVEDAKSIVAILARKAEALQRENAELRKALKPLAAEADCWSSAYPDTCLVARTSKISLGTIRRARALLGGENAE